MIDMDGNSEDRIPSAENKYRYTYMKEPKNTLENSNIPAILRYIYTTYLSSDVVVATHVPF
jgi:hypothetical protein